MPNSADLDAVYSTDNTMTPNHAAQLFFRDADLDGDEHVTFDEVRAAAKRAALRKLPSRVDVVVHSCRGLAHYSSVKEFVVLRDRHARGAHVLYCKCRRRALFSFSLAILYAFTQI